MTRKATPEAQMQKLIRETIEALPSTARAVSTLGRAYNMIDRLVKERDRALKAGRLMTERLDAIARLPRFEVRDDDTGWIDWDDVEPLIAPSQSEPWDAPASAPIADIESTASALGEPAPTMDPNVLEEMAHVCNEVGLHARAQMLERAGNTMACEVRNLMAVNPLCSLVDGERYRLRGLLRGITSKWDRASGWSDAREGKED